VKAKVAISCTLALVPFEHFQYSAANVKVPSP